MLVIRTAEEMACALASSLQPVIRERLAAHRDHLLDYPDYAFEELGMFIIVQPDDNLNDLNCVTGTSLAGRGRFTLEPESILRQDDCLELLFVISDDGFGAVLFVPLAEELDSVLLAACKDLAPSLNLSVPPKATAR